MVPVSRSYLNSLTCLSYERIRPSAPTLLSVVVFYCSSRKETATFPFLPCDLLWPEWHYYWIFTFHFSTGSGIPSFIDITFMGLICGTDTNQPHLGAGCVSQWFGMIQQPWYQSQYQMTHQRDGSYPIFILIILDNISNHLTGSKKFWL